MSEEGSTGAGSAVTIGAFDGVHLGHRRLVGELRRTAEEQGLRCVVVTFDRHPASVVRPESAPLLLTDLEQKVELLRDAGAGEVMVLRFDEVRAAEPAEQFVDEVLAARLAARVVIVGSDFHFGHGRRGNVALLRTMGDGLGFSVVGYDLVDDAGDCEVISSTRIRSLLAEGDVEGAAVLLGRHHEVRGRLELGPGDGGALAVPPSIAVPRAGTYDAELASASGGGVRRLLAVVPLVTAGHLSARQVDLELEPYEDDLAGGANPAPGDGGARLRFLSPAGRAAAGARRSGT